MSDRAERQIHYEVYSRRSAQGPWTLEMASESRDTVMLGAAELLASGRGLSVRVTKETFDPESNEFRSVTLMTRTVEATGNKPKLAADADAACATPDDLYTPQAREKVGRLLEDWLRTHKVTPFELMHRPDLAEKLEASGHELLHVAQKLAVPESHNTGQDLHELIRRWGSLFDRAVNRLIKDGRAGVFPELSPEGGLKAVEALTDNPAREYLLGGGLAALMAPFKRPFEKLKALLPLAVQLGDSHDWAMALIETPVVELFNARASLNDILEQELDLGQAMGIMTRLTIEGAEDGIQGADDSNVLTTPLTGVLAAYHDLIVKGRFPNLKSGFSRRIVQELKGQRRLRPNDPQAEVETLRLISHYMGLDKRDLYYGEDIDDAFYERSKKLVSADFVDGLLRSAASVPEEAEKVIWLCENVTGAANKRQGARWLLSIITAPKFERFLRDGPQGNAHLAIQTANQRLAFLAQLQKRVRTELDSREGEDLAARLGQFASLIADDVKLMAHIAKAQTSPVQKLSLLLGLATGQTAPLGPLAEKAKIQAIRMLRDPEMRAGLSSQPAALTALKPMMQAAGLAA